MYCRSACAWLSRSFHSTWLWIILHYHYPCQPTPNYAIWRSKQTLLPLYRPSPMVEVIIVALLFSLYWLDDKTWMSLLFSLASASSSLILRMNTKCKILIANRKTVNLQLFRYFMINMFHCSRCSKSPKILPLQIENKDFWQQGYWSHLAP